jgi:hypothetical protein
MTERYFEKFQTINYNGFRALNLLSRVVVSRNTTNNPYNYYDYEVQNGQRADYIAYKYYDDTFASWIIYLGNNIIDPYYGWKLDWDSFNKFIVDAYGSISAATSKIAFYRVNWYTDESVISTAAFNNLACSSNANTALNVDLKKYWMPIFDGNGITQYYVRKPIDWTVETNSIVNMKTANSTVFTYGEVVKFYSDQRLGNLIGSSEVTHSNTSFTVLKNNQGFANSTTYAVGTTSNLVDTVTTYTYVANSIPNNGEQVYWSPVSCYDYELEKNSNLTNIKIINSGLYNQAVNMLKTELA